MRAKAPRGPSGPGKREKNKERTKERILAAALKLFKEKGLEGTTTKEISKRSGIAEGTLFNYFKTKEDLALYFFQKETDDLIAWFRAEPRLRKAPLTEQLFAIIHRQLEYIEPYEDFIGAFLPFAATLLDIKPAEFRVAGIAAEISSIHSRSARRGRRERKTFRASAIWELTRWGLFYLGVVAYWLPQGRIREGNKKRWRCWIARSTSARNSVGIRIRGLLC